MSSPERFSIALAQLAPVLGDARANVERALALGEEAADRGAALLVLPELALTGYSLEDLVAEVACPVDDPVLEPLRELSRRLAIVAGFVEEGGDSALYNAAAYWQDGEIVAVHRKVYLPTYGLFDEGRFLARGHALGAFDTGLGRLGMLICEDIWHPSTMYVVAQDDARMVLVPSASPTRVAGGPEASPIGSVWYDFLRAYAVLHGLFVVFVNRVGFEDGVNFWGGSVVVGPDGKMRGRAPLLDEGLTLVDIDMTDVLRERTRSHHVWEEDAELTLRSLEAVLRRRRQAAAAARRPGGGAAARPPASGEPPAPDLRQLGR